MGTSLREIVPLEIRRYACDDSERVGDFLAGMAAPIALFWVVIGYFQQGEELSLNTKALELQQKETATLARNMDREAKVSEELMFRQTMASQLMRWTPPLTSSASKVPKS